MNPNEIIFHLVQRLQHYKDTNPAPEYDPTDGHDRGRHTYCHLMIHLRDDEKPYNPGWHRIEVRGFRVAPDYNMIDISAVSWTLAAGTCSIAINDLNCHRWKILEDEPTIQVLYG